MASQWLILLGTAIHAALGTIHLAYTFFGLRLHPRDPALPDPDRGAGDRSHVFRRGAAVAAGLTQTRGAAGQGTPASESGGGAVPSTTAAQAWSSARCVGGNSGT